MTGAVPQAPADLAAKVVLARVGKKFVDMKRGLRAGLFTQYMPAEAYPLHADFPKAVVADVMAMAQG